MSQITRLSFFSLSLPPSSAGLLVIAHLLLLLGNYVGGASSLRKQSEAAEIELFLQHPSAVDTCDAEPNETGPSASLHVVSESLVQSVHVIGILRRL